MRRIRLPGLGLFRRRQRPRTAPAPDNSLFNGVGAALRAGVPIPLDEGGLRMRELLAGPHDEGDARMRDLIVKLREIEQRPDAPPAEPTLL